MRDCCKCCKEKEVACPIKDCERWINYKDDLNCSLISIEKHGRMTLREVADRMGVSFVRIKQLQDKALKKITKSGLGIFLNRESTYYKE